MPRYRSYGINVFPVPLLQTTAYNRDVSREYCLNLTRGKFEVEGRTYIIAWTKKYFNL